MSNKNDRWSALSLKDRADLMNMYITNGISDLKEMKKHYNSFGDGGDTDDTKVQIPTTNIVTTDNYQEKLDEFNQYRQQAVTAIDLYDWDTFKENLNKSDSLGREIAKYILNEHEKYKGSPLNDGNWAGTSEIKEPEDINFLLRSNIREDGKDVTEWLKSYVNSEGFDRVRKNQESWWKKRHPYQKILFPIFKGVDNNSKLNHYQQDISNYADKMLNYVLDGYPEMSFSKLYKGATFTFKPKIREDKEFPFDFVQMHEFDHLFNDTASSYKTINFEAMKQNTNTEEGHDSRSIEKHSDIIGLKYLLYKEGIYDSRGGNDITPEQIGELRKKYPKLRPLIQMDDEKAAWMLNHVAQNTDKDRLDYVNPDNIAAFGGKLNKFEYGGNTDSAVYYYDTPIEASVVKAFNSKEDYNRYYGEQFGKKVAEGMNNAAPFVLDAAMLPFTISGAIEAPMLLYQGVKAAPQLIRGAKTLLTKGKKALGKKVLGMVDDMNGYVKEGSHFRIVDKPAIDDAISSGTIRSKTGLYHGTPEHLRSNFSKYLDDIPGWESMDANELRSILENKGAFEGMSDAVKFEAKLMIRNSTNHGGTVGYFKNMPYPNYNISNSNYVIETPESIGSFVAGHGGKEFVDIPLEHAGATLLKTNGSVKGASIPSKGSSYWEYSPFFEMWKNKKFNNGGKLLTKNTYSGIKNTQTPPVQIMPSDALLQGLYQNTDKLGFERVVPAITTIEQVWEKADKEYDDFIDRLYSLDYKEPFTDDSERVTITAPNTTISKFIFNNKISKNALAEISRVSKLRNQDPYDVLAHMLIEGSGYDITTDTRYNTHDSLTGQIKPKYYNYFKDDRVKQLKQFGIWQKDKVFTVEEILKASEKFNKERNEQLNNVIRAQSYIDEVALRMLLKGRDFNPAQKGYVNSKGEEVKNTYLDMIDSAITSLKENMPDLFK